MIFTLTVSEICELCLVCLKTKMFFYVKCTYVSIIY